MSRDTNKALSEINDEGLFEEVATAVLREAHPLCAGLVHPGVNALVPQPDDKRGMSIDCSLACQSCWQGYEFSADQLSAQLGYDPLLIALCDYGAESDPRDVIGGYIERALARAQEQGAAHALALHAALMQLTDQMLRRRQLDPTWNEAEAWGLTDSQLKCIAQLARLRNCSASTARLPTNV